MPDANRSPSHPFDWSETFAAMPLETPPSGAWSSVASRLPARAAPDGMRMTSTRRRWATAAAIGIAAVGGWLIMSTPRPSQDGAETALAHVASDIASPSATRVASASKPEIPSSIDDSKGHDSRPSNGRASLASTLDRSSDRDRADARAFPHVGTSHEPNTAVPTASIEPPAASLDALRAESARLEALVSLARNDALQSGPSLVITAEADDRLRMIDAALSQPELTEDQRVNLWNGRVAALGELAAIEGSQRWMAAQGIAMDAVARVD